MSDTRKANINWKIKTNLNGSTPYEDAHLATLMDIRDELQTLNSVFRCVNFVQIPAVLKAIRKNTTQPKVKK